MLMASGLVFSADFNKGLKAAQSGDYKTAIAEFTPLAEQGDPVIQYILAIMYFHGEGVPKNENTGVKWYTKSAEQGNINAQALLGNFFREGKIVPKNYYTSVKWYTKAAEQGEANAQYALGVMYFAGSGTFPDNRRAYMWLNLARYNGDETAGLVQDEIAAQMNSADISKAQDMSSRCLESNYTDC